MSFIENCYNYQLDDVRVVTNAAGSNTVQQCKHVSGYSGNAWLTVCGSGWDCREATVACREMLNIDNPSKEYELPVFLLPNYHYRSNTKYFIL